MNINMEPEPTTDIIDDMLQATIDGDAALTVEPTAKCFGVSEFIIKEGSSEKYITPLPPLPQIKSYYETADFKNLPSDFMSSAEEHQRFMEYNYAKFVALTPRVTHLRDYIVRRNMPMMYAMVSRFSKQFAIDWDDALSECQGKFLESIDGFDPTMGLKFSTYVCRIIRNTLVLLATKQKGSEQQERKVKWQTRKNARTEVVTGLSTMIDAEDLPVLELREALYGNKAGLTARERIVLIHRYGLTGNRKKTLNEIGAHLALSREQIRLIEGTAVEKLKEWFEARREAEMQQNAA